MRNCEVGVNSVPCIFQKRWSQWILCFYFLSHLYLRIRSKLHRNVLTVPQANRVLWMHLWFILFFGWLCVKVIYVGWTKMKLEWLPPRISALSISDEQFMIPIGNWIVLLTRRILKPSKSSDSSTVKSSTLSIRISMFRFWEFGQNRTSNEGTGWTAQLWTFLDWADNTRGNWRHCILTTKSMTFPWFFLYSLYPKQTEWVSNHSKRSYQSFRWQKKRIDSRVERPVPEHLFYISCSKKPRGPLSGSRKLKYSNPC